MQKSDAVRAPGRPAAVALACLLLFVLLMGLVHSRLLADLDLRFARTLASWSSPVVDAAAIVTGIIFAGQMSLLIGLAASLALWRLGLGRWSLAPMAFLIAVGIEAALKLTVNQPIGELALLHRATYYPFAGVSLGGAFPSGHASRTWFFCSFLSVLLWQRSGTPYRAASVGLLLVACLVSFTRLYIADHWLTDVIGGLLLGTALSLLVSPPVARRLRPRQGAEVKGM